MNCPFCQHPETKVIDKRDNTDTNTTRRRRECLNCEKRFTTYERIENLNLFVVKRSGRVEEFDRQKLKKGITRAVRKKAVAESEIEEMVQNIEQQLLNYPSNQISVDEIGELVLKGLYELDKLSYLLFSAVYRNYQSVEDMQAEIDKISQPT